MTDTYEINFSQMSDNLTSIVDTKYGTLDSIQKSLNSNLAQNPNLRPNSTEAIRARRLSEEPETLEQLSKKFKISRERIRQIETKAFEKLQKSMINASKSKNLLPVN